MIETPREYKEEEFDLSRVPKYGVYLDRWLEEGDMTTDPKV